MNKSIFFLIAGVIMLLIGQPCAEALGALPRNSAKIRLGDWRAQFSPDRNIELWYRDVPVVRRSTLYMIKPGWAGMLYDGRAGKPDVTAGATPDGAGLTIRTRDKNADMTVGYTITLSADGSATTDLEYSLNHDMPGEMEYAAGYLNAALLSGAKYAAATTDGVKQGMIPIATPSTDQKANMFVPPFRILTLQTRMGTLNIHVSGDWPDFVCFDARRDPQSWAQEAPVFWMGLGVTPHPLQYADGRTFHVVTRYRFSPRMAASIPSKPKAIAKLRILPICDARMPTSAPTTVIPQPKAMTLTGERLGVNTQTRLVVADDAAAQDKEAAIAVRQELSNQFGLHGLRIVRAATVGVPRNVLVFGEPSRMPLAAKLLKAAGAQPATKAEGYTLRIEPTWAIIAGHDRAGTFYGAQTLRQLVSLDSRGPFLQGAAIDDYPALPWRGAHLFIGDKALPFHRKLIQNIFARLKMNNLVLQCEQAKWDATGESAPKWAMSKNDLRQEIAFANRHFLTVTPLVESVGHMDWLFSDPARASLAEDPQTPYAIKVASPAADRFLYRLYDEVLGVFHPKFFHIGGDEVTMRGRYPYASAATYPTTVDAFTAQVAKLRDYLKSKGVGTMMWGDMMLANGEAPDATNARSLAQAEQMRALLPKDIVITDWHYAPSDDFSGPQIFRRAGFQRVIGATWLNPQNIAAFGHSLAQNHQWGLLQTTWAGFNSNEKNLKDDPAQFAAFVEAADVAWTGKPILPKDMPDSPGHIFTTWYAPTPRDQRVRPGFLVDLSPLTDRALADNTSRTGWLGYGPGHDLHTVPVGAQRLGEVKYEIGPRAVLMAGAFDPAKPSGATFPMQVRLPISRHASALSLVLATGFASLPKAAIGAITVTYTDGATATLPLICDQNIAAWNDTRDAPNAPVVWRGLTAAKEPILLRALTWVNPKPRKTIASLTLTVTDKAASPALFAVTGLE